jgi:hypothetical protein
MESADNGVKGALKALGVVKGTGFNSSTLLRGRSSIRYEQDSYKVQMRVQIPTSLLAAA